VPTPGQPTKPTGVAAGTTGTTYSFSTGGSNASNPQNHVQYLFNWGDATNSGWLAVGTLTAPHAWSTAGSYTVTAQARSETNPLVVSVLSDGLSVLISAPGETVSKPPIPVCTTCGSQPVARATYSFTAGGSTSTYGNTVEYQLNWGDSRSGPALSGWVPAGTIVTHSWASTGTYPVTVWARSTNTLVLSPYSDALTVQLFDPVPTPLSFSPQGTGYGQTTFSAVVSDWDLAGNIQEVHDWFDSAGGGCHLEWYRSNNRVYLDSPENYWNWTGGSGAPGENTTLSNGVCQVNLASTVVYSSRNTVTLSVPITFTAPGTYAEKVEARNLAGGWSQWAYFGTWRVPPAPSARFSISSPTFHVGNTWTLWLNTNVPNTTFTLCGILNGGATQCAPGWGTTDGDGYWSQSGPANTIVSWQEWIEFPGVVTSNSISYTVSP
jgi:hypothetical protein